MIHVALSADQTLLIETSIVTLRDGQPVVNVMSLDRWSCEGVRPDGEQMELRYSSPALGDGAFHI